MLIKSVEHGAGTEHGREPCVEKDDYNGTSSLNRVNCLQAISEQSPGWQTIRI